MNVLTAFLSKLTSRWPAIVLGCASVGALGGWIGGMISFSRQPLVFASQAFLYPAGRVTGQPAISWMETEAAAMRQKAFLEEVARRVNLVESWHKTPAECAVILKDSVRVTVATMNKKHMMVDREVPADSSTDATGFSVLKIEMQGEQSAECTAIVQAMINLREDTWLKAEGIRMASHPDTLKYEAKMREAKVWSDRQAGLRRKLVASLPATAFAKADSTLAPGPQTQRLGSLLVTGASAAPPVKESTETFLSTSRLADLKLTGALKDLQDEWRKAGEEHDRAVLEAGKPNMYLAPYASVLQKPHTAVDPISPQWSTFGWPWTLGGLAAGLLAGLVFYRLKAWRRVEDAAPALPPATAAEF